LGVHFCQLHLQSEIDFNISHAGEWVVCAFTRAARVGVDAVDINEFDDWRELSVTILVPLERSHVSTVKSARQQEIVAWYWSVKEAVLKCAGVGLQIVP
jgi:4'-phosphopantetheinyl transferase